MKDEKDKIGTIVAAVLTCIIFFVMMFAEEEDTTLKCIKEDCNNEYVAGSYYCYVHKSYTGSSHKTTSGGGSVSGGTSKSATNSGTTSSSKKSTSSSSASKKSSGSSGWSSYDEGYDAVYNDDDYDWDRYCSDSDYANGVDDAMDELEW